MKITEKDIYQLHQKYSEGENQKELLDLVWTHSKIVEEISLLIISNLENKLKVNIDKELVKLGALVHDIGCYNCSFIRKNDKPYIKHGEIGYEILLKEKYPTELSRFALIHLGVGLTKENIIKNSLPLDPKDYIPITLEEEIVAYADNYHSKGKKYFEDFESIKVKLIGFHDESGIIIERFRKKFDIPDLKELSRLVEFNDKMR